jgi:tetratricopeptide (TPR) repeat protein
MILMDRSASQAAAGAVILLLLLCASPTSLADDFERGEASLRAGRPEEALEAFRKASAGSPIDWRARKRVADCLRALGRPREAEEAYFAVLRDIPLDAYDAEQKVLPALFPDWWSVLQAAGEYDRASARLEALGKKWGERKTHAQFRALVLHTAAKLDKALIAYQELEARHGPDGWSRLNLGLLLERKGRFREAAEAYLYALRENPGRAGAAGPGPDPFVKLNLIGYRWAALRRFGPARDAWKALAAVENLPKKALARTWANLAILYMNHGRPERAGEAYRKSLEHDPDDPDTWNNLGLLMWSQGNLDGAKGQFTQALRLDENYTNGYENIGNLEFRRLRPGRALRYFEKGLDKALAGVRVAEKALNEGTKGKEGGAAEREALRQNLERARYTVFRFRTYLGDVREALKGK